MLTARFDQMSENNHNAALAPTLLIEIWIFQKRADGGQLPRQQQI
jgi:hypothetical protein